NATRLLTTDYANGKWNHRFWTSTMQAVVGAPHDEIDRTRFWNSVAFYNYVQGSAGMTAGRAPPRALWESSELAFFSVLKRLRPDCMLVLSRRLWSNMSSQGSSGPELLVDGQGRDTWVYPYPGGTAIATWIPHPSYGFSWRRWHPV